MSRESKLGTRRLVVALVVSAVASTAQAANFTIANGDVGGLITAMNMASVNGEDDVIELAANGTYTLTVIDNFVGGPNGLPSVAADGGRALTINGNGATIERSVVAPQFRILHVEIGADLTLNEAILVGGDVDGLPFPDNSGGAIANLGTADLFSVALTGHLGSNGSAVRNAGMMHIESSLLNMNSGTDGTINNRDDAILTISDTDIEDNDAVQGGAIFNSATVTATESRFSRNRAIGSPGSKGGAIDNAGRGIVTLTDVAFSANSATDSGGTIFNTNTGTVNITRGSVSQSINAAGSAALHNRGSMTIIGTMISDNLDSGITNIAEGPNFLAELYVEGATITNNNEWGLRNAAEPANPPLTQEANATVVATTIGDHTQFAVGSFASGEPTNRVSLTLTRCRIEGAIRGDVVGAGNSSTISIIDTDIEKLSGTDAMFVIASEQATSTTTIVGSTFRGSGQNGVAQLAMQGGGADMLIANSTVTGHFNGVRTIGSGSALELRHVTINNNRTGLREASAAAVSVYNTIIANSTLANCALMFGPLASSPPNLSDDPTCPGALDFVQVEDMRLGPLRDNGGPTLTHRLQPTSPAIDAANDQRCAELVDGSGTPITTDQRGGDFPRRVGPQCDVGAFEFSQPLAPAPALGNKALALAITLILAIGTLGLRRRRESEMGTGPNFNR